MIHHTVGVYINPLAPMKHNGVTPENLQKHIGYNIENRPGRLLVVDGVVAYNPGFPEIYVEHILATIAAGPKPTKDTRPYV